MIKTIVYVLLHCNSRLFCQQCGLGDIYCWHNSLRDKVLRVEHEIAVHTPVFLFFYIMMILYSAMSNDDVGMALYKN